MEKSEHNEPKGRIKIVGFDMDGTLVNTMGQFPVIFGQFINKYYRINPEEAGVFFLQNLGTSIYDQIYKLIGNTAGSPQEVLAISKQINEALSEVESDPFPDVPDVLQTIKDQGYKTFVSSSHSDEAINKVLKRAKLTDFIDFFVGKDLQKPEFTKGEPHFRVVADNFKVAYEAFVNQTMFIGDSLADISTAKDAGVFTVGRRGTYSYQTLENANPNFIVGDLSIIPKLLPSL